MNPTIAVLMSISGISDIILRRGINMTTWTDSMIKEYFDTNWSATIHQICGLSGRTKADVKAVLMGTSK
jgi:hypothetical protein